jgi:hypothetical protein
MHQADEVANDLFRTEALGRNRDRYGHQRPDRSSAATTTINTSDRNAAAMKGVPVRMVEVPNCVEPKQR